MSFVESFYKKKCKIKRIKEMFNVVTKEMEWNGSKLKLETGLIARQAHSAVVVTMGETVVLCTVVVGNKVADDLDFLALTVNYQEKFYAVGKIPGGFIKRETKPSDGESLISRLVDRAIRPLFKKDYFRDIQVICTVLSYDYKNEPDILALIGTSAAIWIAGLPVYEPIAGIRVGYKNGEFVCNPTIENCANGELELVVAGTGSSIFMVESEAKELSVDTMLSAISFGQCRMLAVIDMIKDFAAAVGVDNTVPRVADMSGMSCAVPNIVLSGVTQPVQVCTKEQCIAEIEASSGYMSEVREAFDEVRKSFRRDKLVALRQRVLHDMVVGKNYPERVVRSAIEFCESSVLRSKVVTGGGRVDGRGVKEIRPINCMLDILPRVHGSALFTRGETQSLATVTIGVASQDRQLSERLSGLKSEGFMMHYNFPPYSVGEIGVLRAPGRREIGHGKLAQKALRAVIPSEEEFVHAIRVVSEITESNGSSSMATVCGASLALMAAGIPIRGHVAGIAMGLIKSERGFVVLSDIMGDEDHLGDMDFKVASTRRGITALQMDIKVDGIDHMIMEVALKQAEEGIVHILGLLENTISMPRKSLSVHAPQMVQIRIPQDKIREVIGSGGKVIKEICSKSDAKVEIEDSGVVKIVANNSDAVEKARGMIRAIVADPEIGEVYDGVVTKITDFGAFVKYFGEAEGLLHISEIANARVLRVSDYLAEGDKVKVRLMSMDKRGGRLSMRAVDGNVDKVEKKGDGVQGGNSSPSVLNDRCVRDGMRSKDGARCTEGCVGECAEVQGGDSVGEGGVYGVSENGVSEEPFVEGDGCGATQQQKRAFKFRADCGKKNGKVQDCGSDANDVRCKPRQKRFF